MADNKYPQTAAQIAEQLQGSCLHLTEVLDSWDMREAEDDLEFCQELDNLIFCCTECDWWFENSDMSEEGDICIECFAGSEDLG